MAETQYNLHTDMTINIHTGLFDYITQDNDEKRLQLRLRGVWVLIE